jgi:adenylate kinase family enzyme
MNARELPLGPRIIVVGVTGSGKTTVSARLARIFGIPHVELDSLHWQPNWVMAGLDEFRQAVASAISGPVWVTDGNYSKVRDLIWPRATTLVWLDYALPVVLWQLTRRTLTRIITRERLWNTNYETLRGAFFSRDSLFLWALHTHPRHRVEYTRLLSQPEYAHLRLVRLHWPKETREWLKGMEKAVIREA